ncbi:MAG: outer membrane lipoprotein LolB [Proteobacteria bacterium]|nr:outer membrane lipoprotein LolB [Pseudomonadota bacterium]
MFRWLCAVALAALLIACAPMRVKPSAATPEALAAQAAREAELFPRTHWTLNAQFGVSNGRDGGSGDLEWKQDGTKYAFTVRAPNGRVVRLDGDADRAELIGVEERPLVDGDPERLLREHAGWDVPLSALRCWVRGLRAPGTQAELTFDANGLPATMRQAGWEIEYRDWYADQNPPLPKRVFASSANSRVKLSIVSWSFER